MNTMVIAPEVREFLSAVRAQLADLDPDEQREILDGLEADLTDLVAERGRESLGDPVAYALELRVAAGLDPMMGRPRVRLAPGEAATAFLDSAHERWDRAVSGLPGNPWEFVVSLRPFWWVARAWIAVQLLDLVFGGGSYGWGLALVPSLHAYGPILLVVAVVLSVQIGRGRLWPTKARGALSRVVLLGLNFIGIVAAPVVLSSFHSPSYFADQAQYAGPSSTVSEGLSFNGEPVRNVYPYDAQGHPLTGIQLLDSSGHRLTLTNDPYNEDIGWGDVLLVPWLNGSTELFNVFPLPEQKLDEASQERVGEPALPSPPVAGLPPVSLTGVTPSVLAPVGDAGTPSPPTTSP